MERVGRAIDTIGRVIETHIPSLSTLPWAMCIFGGVNAASLGVCDAYNQPYVVVFFVILEHTQY